MCSMLLRFLPGERFLLLLTVAMFVLTSGCDFLLEEAEVDEISNPIHRVFEGRLTYKAGQTPYIVLLGDLNRDGLPDMVTLNWTDPTTDLTDQTASVLLAEAGGYAAPVDYFIGATPQAGLLTDVAGNGFLDLVVVNEALDRITILLGDGEGAFTETVELPLPEGAMPRAVAVADLSGNGWPDLVTANGGLNTISILVGMGNAYFEYLGEIAVGQRPSGLWVGPLTPEEPPSILVTNRDSNTLSFIQYNGLEYAHRRVIPCGNEPRDITAVDLNLNGYLDLLVSNLKTGTISILHGSEGGQFGPETIYEFPKPVARFVVADFSGNMIPDMAAVLFDSTGTDRRSADLFCVAQGDGLGGFRRPAATYGAGWGAVSIAVADMNGNNRHDLVTADLTRSTVSIAYGRGDATFQSERVFTLGSNPGPAVLADFTQNGKIDIAVANRGDNSIYIMAGGGDGALTRENTLLLPATPLALATGDLNGNGRPDLVVSLDMQYAVWVYLSSGNGTFQPPSVYNILENIQGVAPQVMSIALGDMNNDGYLDIVTGNTKRDSASILLNDGAGRFGTLAFSSYVGNYPLDIHLRDVNRDGNLDLIFTSTNDPAKPTDNADPRVVRWFGKGDGTLDGETYARFATGSAPRAMAMGDVSGNGRADAVTLHPGGKGVYLLEGVSDNTFSAGARLIVAENPTAHVLADINRNGKRDLVCATGAGSVIVRFSRGGMAFEGTNNFIIQPGISKILTADLNGDTHLDLIAINEKRNVLMVFLGARF